MLLVVLLWSAQTQALQLVLLAEVVEEDWAIFFVLSAATLPSCPHLARMSLTASEV